MSWHLKYREEFWIKKFEAKFWSESRQRFDDPEDACAEAISHLLMVKLPAVKLKNRDNLDGFVMGVFGCIVTDLSRRYSGRLHAPSFLKKKGGAFLKIFFEYCIQKNPVDVIAEKLKLPEISVKELVNWLKEKNKCPQQRQTISLSDEIDSATLRGHDALVDTGADPVEQHIESANSEMISLIVHWFNGDSTPDTDSQVRQSQLEKKLSRLSRPPISPDDHLLLKLVYWEGLSMSATARALHMSRKKAQKQHDQILATLQLFFHQHGVTS